jgi:ferric-dicitrate binding protein FerR (iron transport regulator)
VVETNYGNVQVLGTAFNVETKANGTEVSVDHGLVAFKNKGEEVKLSAGQSAISDKSGVSEIVAVDANYLSWKSGVFHFENTPLEEVIAEMNKFYPETITFDRMTTSNLMITGDFDNRPVEELIEVIVLTCGLNAEYGEGTISLK